MVTANKLLTVILHWSSRVTRCLFWVCFHLVSRAYLELCYSNLFMFKCHLSGLAKEALVVGVHIGWKLRIPQLGVGVFSLHLQRREHFRSNQTSFMKISNEIWLWRVWGMQRCNGRNLTVNWFQMFNHAVCVCVCNLHWSVPKRMHRFFRDGERWNSSTIVV